MQRDLRDGALSIDLEYDGGAPIGKGAGRVTGAAVCAAEGFFLRLMALPHPLGAGQSSAVR